MLGRLLSRLLVGVILISATLATVSGAIGAVATLDPGLIGLLYPPRSSPSPTAIPASTPAQQSVVPAPPAGADWAQYRFDVSGTGANPEALIDSTNVTSLRERWTWNSGSGTFAATPTVVQGVVYVPRGSALYAIDFASGRTLWSYDLNAPQGPFGITSSVAVDPNTHLAYFGTPYAQVYALDTRSGALAWHTALDATVGAYVWGSPLIVHGKLYIGVASEDDNPCVRGAVYALNPATGATVWVHYMAPEGEIGGGVWSSQTADPETHTIIATTGNPCENAARNDDVSDYQQDSIVGMDWDTGATHWAFNAVATDTCDCDFGGGAVSFDDAGQHYYVAGNKYGAVYALQRHDQGVQLAWSREVLAPSNADASPPVIGEFVQPPSYADGTVLISGGQPLDDQCIGSVWAFDAATGATRWRACTDDRPIGAGAISGDLFFIAYMKTVEAYQISTGQFVWRATVPSEVWGGITIAHGSLIVGTVDGQLLRFAPGGTP